MDININSICAVILAGGKGKRMGGINKALLRINGRPLIELQIENLRSIFPRVIIAGGKVPFYKEFGEFVPDLYPDIGPIGGIYSALNYLEDKNIFVVGCDMPFIIKDLITNMSDIFIKNLHGIEVLCPQQNDYIHPLYSLWSYKIKEEILSGIKKGDYSLISLIKRVRYKTFRIRDEDAMALMNINTPEDYERVIRLYGKSKL